MAACSSWIPPVSGYFFSISFLATVLHYWTSKWWTAPGLISSLLLSMYNLPLHLIYSVHFIFQLKQLLSQAQFSILNFTLTYPGPIQTLRHFKFLFQSFQPQSHWLPKPESWESHLIPALLHHSFSFIIESIDSTSKTWLKFSYSHLHCHNPKRSHHQVYYNRLLNCFPLLLQSILHIQQSEQYPNASQHFYLLLPSCFHCSAPITLAFFRVSVLWLPLSCFEALYMLFPLPGILFFFKWKS